MTNPLDSPQHRIPWTLNETPDGDQVVVRVYEAPQAARERLTLGLAMRANHIVAAPLILRHGDAALTLLHRDKHPQAQTSVELPHAVTLALTDAHFRYWLDLCLAALAGAAVADVAALSRFETYHVGRDAAGRLRQMTRIIAVRWAFSADGRTP